MLPEQIPAAAYTHINFAFAMIDPVTFAVAPMSASDVDLYSRVTGLKTIYPNLKVSPYPRRPSTAWAVC
jgi:GH18 family chitinase